MIVINAISRNLYPSLLQFTCSLFSSPRKAVTVSQALSILEQNPQSHHTFQSKNINIEPDSSDIIGDFLSQLDASTNIKSIKQVHARILVCGFRNNVLLGSKLVRVYSERRSLQDARQVFDNMPRRNAFIWNAILRGYAWNEPHEDALILYSQMQREGILPDTYSYAFALKACAALSDLPAGKKIHCQIILSGFESHVFVSTTLLDMYGKCGRLEDARQVFEEIPQRDVTVWNAMIAGYVQNRCANEAVTLFYQMIWEDMKPDSATMVNVIPACANMGNLRIVKGVHLYVVKNTFDVDLFVCNALVDMYGKCGSLDIARRLFDKMLQRDVVSWNAIIVGYAQNGHSDEALSVFHQMLEGNVTPNSITISSVISACAHLGALEQGKWIHEYIYENGLELDVYVTNSLIGMYAKCGKLEVAQQLFNEMPRRDVSSWNAMLAGHGLHGHGRETLELFSEMKQSGMLPNHITFIHILSACSHAGLVDEGCRCFDFMTQDCGIQPNMEHYACMVDLLGRAGDLEEAESFIKKMPVEPDIGVWGTLLGACRIHKNIELGKCVADHVFNLDPIYPGYYVLLSNMYAEAGRWDKVSIVRRMMKERNVKKIPGCSVVELDGNVHTFYAGDKSHPQADEIYAMLGTLAWQMEKAGYIPNTNFALHDVEEEEKEDMLCSHSERLAIAFVLINTSPGTPVRFSKNLRVCGDCHTATKFISTIVKREIIVRDVQRFHHFKDGICSCRDYW